MNVLYQDKATLLTELQELRMRNKKLEFDLNELLQSYETKRDVQSQYNLEQLSEEFADMKSEHQNMRENYDYKLELLRIRLEKVSNENQQLKNENLELIQQQNEKQQDKRKEIAVNKGSKILQNSEIENFCQQVTKLKQVIDEKIVKKKKESKKKNFKK